MKVSCYCITYNRPELLEEAIESFLRQDYTGEKELVILNDCPGQTLSFSHPEVVIANVPRRFRTIGEKRNAGIALCSGDVIFPWDDDDICLPWRLSVCLKHKGPRPYFKDKKAWHWQNGIIRPDPVYNAYPSMGCWDRELFEAVNGYSFMQSGQDMDLDKKFEKAGKRFLVDLPKEETYYIYRFGGTGHPHLSSFGWGKGWTEIGKKELTRCGAIELHPNWKENYDARARERCRKPAIAEAQQSTESATGTKA